jgi:nudix-type nucleoside diphosphatase (YffH/AdpP family)
MQDQVEIRDVRVLSEDWGRLHKTTFALRRADGAWAEQTRETYDRGNGAVLLLYNLARRTVVLTRQFRLPAYLNGHDGFLVEAAAGLLDGFRPEERIRAEVEEETGYRVKAVRHLWDAFMSPGSVTERLHFFVAEYEERDRVGAGGGLAEEGEDLEVLELGIDSALAMIGSGIVDGKTIMLLQYARQHLFAPAGMMILIAGPYRSGTADDPARIARNVAAMEACVMPLYRAGHLPAGRMAGAADRAPGRIETSRRCRVRRGVPPACAASADTLRCRAAHPRRVRRRRADGGHRAPAGQAGVLQPGRGAACLRSHG